MAELLDEAHYDALYEALDHREVQAALSTCGGDDHGDDDPAHDECSAGLSKEDLSTCETALRWTREQLRARKPMARSKELRTDGATVLHFAAAWGFRVTARVAIELGADVDATEEAGDTPLLTAAWFGDADIVQLLLSHDAAVDAISPKGEIVIDDGARQALSNGKSLLAAGIKKVSGKFKKGDHIKVLNKQNSECARGLSSFSSDEILKIMGHHSKEIEKLLGYVTKSEVIHKDDMVEI